MKEQEKQEQEYQQLYRDTFDKGIRKLRWMSFIGFSYSRCNDEIEKLNNRLNDISLEMFNHNFSRDYFATRPILNRQEKFLELKVKNDLRVLI
jgi:hypothetical protein